MKKEKNEDRVLFSQEIVSVQPMTLPLGLKFYLNYSYSNKKDQKDEIRKEKSAEKKRRISNIRTERKNKP